MLAIARVLTYVGMAWACYICLDTAILLQKGELTANDVFLFSVCAPLLVIAPIEYSKST